MFFGEEVDDGEGFPEDEGLVVLLFVGDDVQAGDGGDGGEFTPFCFLGGEGS